MWAVVRVGDNGRDVLAMVDRKRTKTQWWTQHRPELVFAYKNRDAAVRKAASLAYGDPSVMDFDEVCGILDAQHDELLAAEAYEETRKC